MKHLYLHIGLHKTGTSLLQGAFLQHEAELARRGIRFPRSGRAPEQRIIHSNLAWEALGHGSFDRSLGTLGDAGQEIEQGDAERWIISTEGLSRLQDPTRFAKQLEGFRRTVVVYTRDPREYLPSRYTEDLKAGARVPFDVWLEKRGRELADHEAIVRRWFRAADSIVWRKFSRATLKNGDLVQDFFEILGCELDHAETSPEIVNPRATHFTCLCTFLWNLIPPPVEAPERTQVDWRRGLRAAAERVAANTRLDGPFDVLHARELEQLRAVLSALGHPAPRARDVTASVDWSPEVDAAVGVVAEQYEKTFGVACSKQQQRRIRRRALQFVGTEA